MRYWNTYQNGQNRALNQAKHHSKNRSKPVLISPLTVQNVFRKLSVMLALYSWQHVQAKEITL